MKNLTKQEWILVFTLASLTALGPLSIDMYLPSFPQIAKDLNTPVSNVQISLSTFLGGLALGQLFWGPIADRYGSKKPILISLCLFILASLACLFIKEIELIWLFRFLQAFGSSGGVVIARAIVNKRFDKTQTLKIFSMLALVGGIAPIVAPLFGNLILQYFHWHHIFTVMALFAVLSIFMTIRFLQEDSTASKQSLKIKTIANNYAKLFKDQSFIRYTLIGSIAYTCLMLYISNAPLLIMDTGGLSSTHFSYIFMLNSCGLMLGSFLTSSIFSKKLHPKKIITLATSIQIISALTLWMCISFQLSIYIQIIPLFFFVAPLGMLFPTATTLALQHFKTDAGTASALFGATQLGFTFLTSIILNSSNEGNMRVWAFVLLISGCLSLVINLGQQKRN